MATNKQILEGLWGLGYSNIQLSAIPTDGNQGEFERTLFVKYGINASDVGKAKKLADWRPGKDLSGDQKLIQAIGISGVSDADQNRIIDIAKKGMAKPGISAGGGVPSAEDVLQAAKQVLNPQVFTNVMIKAGMGDQIGRFPDVIQWNPMRGDTAPHPVTPQGTPAPVAPPPAAPEKAPTPPATPAPPKTPLAPGAPGTPTGVQRAPGAEDKGLPKNATDAQIDDYVRKNYGADAWMLNIPELAGIARDVVKTPGGWTQSSMDSAIQKTQWWTANGENVANFLRAQTTNAHGLNDEILKKQKTIEQRASANGMTLPADRVLQIATDWQKWGWDDNTVNATIAQDFHYQTGQAATGFTDRLKTLAKDQLVPVDDATLQLWGQKIIANPAEENNFKEFLKNQAVSTWPSFADRLNTGETMKTISSSYANTAAQTLEMQPGDIDFTQPKWMSALDQVDDKGNHSHMSQPDWLRKIQSDPQYGYDYTNGAKQQAGTFVTDILTKFGHMG